MTTDQISKPVQYRGYWYRQVPNSTVGRCRVWAPDGTYICMCSEEEARRVIDWELRPVQFELFQEAA